MEVRKRERILFLITMICLGIFLADKLLITPLYGLWEKRSARMDQLKTSVSDGEFLLQRANAIEQRNEEMKKRSLPTDVSLAENRVLAAVNRWSDKSGLSLSSIKPRWDRSEEDYMQLEIGVAGSGRIKSISRFLYELEKDPLAVSLQSVSVSARDESGRTLSLVAQFTGLVLPDAMTSDKLKPSKSIPGFDEFAVLYENNIFDPDRRPNRPEPEPTPEGTPGGESESTRSLAVIGVLVRETRALAFFVGSDIEGSAYGVGRSVDGLEITHIDTNAVTLKQEENEYLLPIGSSIEKKSDGQWEVVDGVSSWDSTSPTTHNSSDDGSSGGGDSSADDMMRKLMERRQKELQ